MLASSPKVLPEVRLGCSSECFAYLIKSCQAGTCVGPDGIGVFNPAVARHTRLNRVVIELERCEMEPVFGSKDKVFCCELIKFLVVATKPTIEITRKRE